MKLNNINNLVFFSFDGEHKDMRQACVFFKDGTTKMISYNEGLELVKELAKENNITTRNGFKEAFAKLVNKNLVHVTTGKEFEKNFKSYMPVKEEKKENEKSTIVMPAISVAKKEKKPVVEEKEEIVLEEKKKPVELEETMFKKVAPKKEKKKKKRLSLRVAAGVIAGVVGFTGLAFGLNKAAKSGKMSLKNFKVFSTEVKDEEKEIVKDNNDYYDSYTFEQLQEVTNNKDQKAEMKRIHDTLVKYNVDFANNYIEEDKDIKAALSFEEMVALSQAYNDFTPKQIKAIFNGKAITAAELDSAYKTATLQLMGAHVIESREHPVDMSGIIIDEEGKAFYEKYHNLFLAAKEATGDEKIAAVEAFYSEVRKDFPIDPDTREVGTMHSSSHEVPESYKLSITPMVAAGEIMWQNLEIDETLKGGVANYFVDFAEIEGKSNEELIEIIKELNQGTVKGEIDYFNDLGLCNIAESKFEIVQQVTMGAFDNEDNENPTYEQYENAIVKELTDKNAYVIDDAHRELSELDRFQEEVNWHFELDEEGYYTGSVYYTTETHTRTRTWKKTKTTKRTEVTRTEKPIPEDVKKEIDDQIDKENKEEKEKAEEKAEEVRKEMQDEEDKKAEEIKEEVKKDEEDLQEKIEDANDKIKENQEITEENKDKPAEEQKPTTPVNEDDFGDHNVDFDDQHSDKDGNLNDSVENITTDGTGAKTPSDLPDPNETGKKFDEEGEKQASSSSSQPKSEAKAESASAPKAEPKSEPAPAPKAEPKSEPAPAPAPAQKSNEEIVDEYVKDLASGDDADYDEAKEYTK